MDVSLATVVALIAKEREASEAPNFGRDKVKVLVGFKGRTGVAMHKAACILMIVFVIPVDASEKRLPIYRTGKGKIFVLFG